MEDEDFLSPKAENGSRMIKKHYLHKVFATHFPNVKIPLKTNAKSIFPKVKKRFRKPYITNGILALFEAKGLPLLASQHLNRLWPPLLHRKEE